MPHVKLVVSTEADTALPRDRVVNTFHFNVQGAVYDGDGLCASMLDAWETNWCTTSPLRKMECWSFDVQGTKPVFHNGYAIKNASATPGASKTNRDVALCLSYYAGQNRPRRRGRIYFPIGLRTSSTGLRPSGTLMNEVLAWGDILSGLGGLNVDWEVWSTVDLAGYKVSNVWVDDEWDTQRRRGMKATTRVVDTVSG